MGQKTAIPSFKYMYFMDTVTLTLEAFLVICTIYCFINVYQIC